MHGNVSVGEKLMNGIYMDFMDYMDYMNEWIEAAVREGVLQK